MNSKVDLYLSKITKWQAETEKLRTLLLDCQLTEDLKWGKPCYSYQDKNIAIIQGFKEYFALLFFKGALLSDPENIFIKMGENTQAGRQIRFADVNQIIALEPTIKACIYEAIEVEKAGLTVDLKKVDDYAIPHELETKLNEFSELKSAFYALTPGRQRAYIIFFSAPKQPKTRESRIEKYIPYILKGKGLSDK
ncbi:MAG: DUF1801 domain-containing protein [Paludibacter sp.]|nr:DUF1801 domain-containing protein [Paludibacter sp.]